jgi:hypothetical protein
VATSSDASTSGGPVTFESELHGMGNNTGIVVPPEVVDQLGAGRRPPVQVDLNGYDYRSTVGVMGGQHLVPVSAAIRKETGLSAGDPIRVTLTLAAAPREVTVPDDFAAALDAAPGTRAFFDGLANSLQRYHVDNINSAKAPETRARRIARAVELFRAGKKR